MTGRFNPAMQPGSVHAPVGRLRRVAYASGNFGKNLLWSTADLTLLFLFTDIMDIEPALAGWLILVSLGVNAILDPVMGALADRIRSPLGRNAPLILIGAPLCALAFAGLYALPALGKASLGLALMLLIAFRAGFSLMDSPHNGLLATLSRDPRDRGSLSALRFLFSSIATMAVIVVIPALTAARAAAGAQSLAFDAAAAALLSTVIMVIAALAVCRSDHPSPDWHIVSRSATPRGLIPLSRPVILLLAITLVINIGMPLFAKMILYHANYVVADPARAHVMLLAMVVGQMVGLPCWILVMRRLPPAEAVGVATMATVAAALGMGAAGGSSPIGDAALACGFGLAAGGIYTMIWVLVADCADLFERQNGIAAPGLIFGLAIVAIKAGQGLGALLSGALLSMSGYAPRLSTAAEVGATITAIQVGGPVAAGIAVTVLLLAYRSSVKRI